MYTLRQYLTTLADTHGLTRTLGEIDVCRDQQGRMCYTAGNSAVVFRIRHEGRIRSLRCYTRPVRHLPEIYGERFLPRELFLYTSPESGVWADVVLGEWIEGQTLHEAIAETAAAGDTARLQALSAAFDRMAARLTADCWAHGDLKPENIVVDENGRLHLIDFDAVFLPAFAGEPSPELGTAAFQHPARTSRDFDASLDDYPATLISTALHALALDPTLYARYHNADGLLFSPQQIHTDEALREVLELFQRTCRAAGYRIARQLYAPTPRLFGIADLLAWAVREEELRSGAQSAPGGCPAAENARNAGYGGKTTAGGRSDGYDSGEPRNALGEKGAPTPAKDGNCGCETGEYGLPAYAACGSGTHAENRQANISARDKALRSEACGRKNGNRRDTASGNGTCGNGKCGNDTPGSEKTACAETPELFVENGLWGYGTPERIAVPPLYDCGFDFTEGLAAVKLGDAWHYIDPAGRPRIHCPGCEAVKPFRGGRARIVRGGRQMEIDREGREFDI